MKTVLKFERNLVGTDYVVGDIHGCFKRLEKMLDAIGFDMTKDRLFCTGDLVDRGPDSLDVLDWLTYHWFHTVPGNHDQMIIDVFHSKVVDATFIDNGGMWYIGLTHEEQAEVAWSLSALPLMIEVDTPHGLVGIVHADVVGNDWEKTKADLGHNTILSYHVENHIKWGRDRFYNTYGKTSPVKGVDLMVVGHNVTETPFKQDNVLFLDTGAVFKGYTFKDGSSCNTGFTLYDMTNCEFLYEKDYGG